MTELVARLFWQLDSYKQVKFGVHREIWSGVGIQCGHHTTESDVPLVPLQVFEYGNHLPNATGPRQVIFCDWLPLLCSSHGFRFWLTLTVDTVPWHPSAVKLFSRTCKANENKGLKQRISY